MKYTQADYILGGWQEVPEKHRTFKPFRAKTHKEAQSKLASMLSVDGPRGLAAVADNGALVGSSLYPDQDFIVPAPKKKRGRK